MDGDAREDPTAQLADAAASQLQGAVRAALGETEAIVRTWDVAPLRGAGGVRAGSSGLYAVAGTADTGTAMRSWKLVLRVLAPVAGQDDPTQDHFWKREALLYGSGLLDDLSVGLRAPRCYGYQERADGTVWLWLEQVTEDAEKPWAIARWALAARHLGQFNGAYLAGRPLPIAPWLAGRRLRAWVERHAPLVAQVAAARDNPALRPWWPASVVAAILRLWSEREGLIGALERLPQTFAHGDAIRRNLISRRRDDGSEETVAIDWEFAGYLAGGEEVGQTLSVAAAFFDLDPADLPALDEALFAGYLDGLREAGWRGDPQSIRFAYAAHAALRNIFNAVGASVPSEEGRERALRNFGHRWEELAERRAAVRPFLLARADEARRFLDNC